MPEGFALSWRPRWKVFSLALFVRTEKSPALTRLFVPVVGFPFVGKKSSRGSLPRICEAGAFGAIGPSFPMWSR
jgi:hypothetical protein